jgi:hypothetical protein
MYVTNTPQVATVHDNYQRVELGPPYRSACLPRDTSMGIRGWPTLSRCISWRYGRVSSNSVTVEDTKFVEPHKSRICQYIIELAHRRQVIGP